MVSILEKLSKYNPNGIDKRENAIKDAIERGYINSIYISKGNRAYEKYRRIEKIINLIL